MCSQWLRAHEAVATAKKWSSCMFFLDITQAFASMQRCFIVDSHMSDYDVMDLFTKMGLDPSAYQQFVQHLGTCSASSQSSLSLGLSSLLYAFTDCTWFQMRGLDHPAVYDQGTGAGTPLADLAFVFAISVILSECRARLLLHGITDLCCDDISPSVIFPSGSTTPFDYSDCSFVDDCCFFIARPDPEWLVEDATKMVEIVTDTFLLHGLTPNFAPGKSEIMFMFRGKSKKKFVAENQLGAGNELDFEKPACNGVSSIRCVDQYKHMGAMLSRFNNCGMELAQNRNKSCEAQSASMSLYRSSSVHAVTKVLHVRIVLHTKLMYLAELWVSPPVRIWKAVASLYIRQIRLVTRSRYVDGCEITDPFILRKWSFLSPSLFVRVRRLKYFRRFLLWAPIELQQLVSLAFTLDPDSWLGKVYDDLRWLSGYEESPSIDPSDDPIKWHQFVTGGDFYLCIRGACNDQVCGDAPCIADPVVPPEDDGIVEPPCEVPSELSCMLCSQAFPTKAQLNLHMFAQHKIKNPCFMYADGSKCPICLKCFHTRPRLLHHWKSSS